ncbi:DNA cytosine methyltransferase [Ilumatobacteraceae bacterium]|nr:DNA cytosine methyltransferase [Ilumatobacteraceae bacterium]
MSKTPAVGEQLEAFDPLSNADVTIVTSFEAGSLVREVRLGEIWSVSKMEMPDGRAKGEPDADALWWLGRLEGWNIDVISGSHLGEQINFIDLFSGSGGFSLGIRMAAEELGVGSRPLAAVDIDADALHVYADNHKPRMILNCSVSDLVDYSTRRLGDEFCFFHAPELINDKLSRLCGRVDLVIGGPPCQGHSNLNNHTRRNDPRNSLYSLVGVVAEAVGARACLTENVPGVVRDHGDIVATTKHLLQSSGWLTEEAVVAADQIGWAQTRKRHFMSAWKGDSANGGVTLGKVYEALKRPARPVSWLLADLLALKSRASIMDQPSQLSEENQQRIAHLFDNDEYTLSNEHRPLSHRNGHSYPASYGRMRWDGPSGTITTGFLTPGRGRFVHAVEPRGLSPREGARLQGYPDSYSFENTSGRTNRTLLAKWIGDAVPTPLGYVAGLGALAHVLGA